MLRFTLHRFASLYYAFAKRNNALPKHLGTILSNTHAKPSRALPYQRITKLDITTAKQITTGLNHDRTMPDLTHAELLGALPYPTDGVTMLNVT